VEAELFLITAEEAEKAPAGLVTQSIYRFLFRVRWRRSYFS
jgi:hypothetical protein